MSIQACWTLRVCNLLACMNQYYWVSIPRHAHAGWYKSWHAVVHFFTIWFSTTTIHYRIYRIPAGTIVRVFVACFLIHWLTQPTSYSRYSAFSSFCNKELIFVIILQNSQDRGALPCRMSWTRTSPEISLPNSYFTQSVQNFIQILRLIFENNENQDEKIKRKPWKGRLSSNYNDRDVRGCRISIGVYMMNARIFYCVI